MVAASILIVEDDVAIQSLLVNILEDEGYRTITASDGATGVHAITNDRPMLVLLDLNLPVLDGEDVLAVLRQARVSLPVVVMTAEPRGQHVADTYKTAGYLPKPFDIGQLLMLVQTALGMSSSAVA